MYNTFTPNEEFKKYVRDKNKKAVLDLLAVILNVDCGFDKGQADGAIEYIKDNFPEFFDKDRNEVFIEDESKWTEEYWTKISVSLYDYCSLEKIKFLKKMGKKLYTSKEEYKDKQEADYDSSKKPIPPLAVVAVAAGVVILIVAGIVISVMKK